MKGKWCVYEESAGGRFQMLRNDITTRKDAKVFARKIVQFYASETGSHVSRLDRNTWAAGGFLISIARNVELESNDSEA